MRRRRGPSTAKCRRRHAKRRALSRYGIELNQERYREVIRQIRQGEAKFLWKETWTRKWFLVRVDEQDMVVIYDRTTRELRTVLTLEQAQETLHAQGIKFQADQYQGAPGQG